MKGAVMRKHIIVLVLGLLALPLTAGATWTTQRLTWNSGNSYKPTIAVDSSNHIHVVWHDDTPGNREIFYKKKN